jgi:hypothetical protein
VVCTTLATWPETFSAGAYDLAQGLTWGDLYTTDPATTPDGGLTDLYLEVYHGFGAAPPYSFTIPATEKWATCLTCFSIYENCNVDFSDCDKAYFARGGSGTVTTASQDARAGQIVATASNLQLV